MMNQENYEHVLPIVNFRTLENLQNKIPHRTVQILYAKIIFLACMLDTKNISHVIDIRHEYLSKTEHLFKWHIWFVSCLTGDVLHT